MPLVMLNHMNKWRSLLFSMLSMAFATADFKRCWWHHPTPAPGIHSFTNAFSVEKMKEIPAMFDDLPGLIFDAPLGPGAAAWFLLHLSKLPG